MTLQEYEAQGGCEGCYFYRAIDVDGRKGCTFNWFDDESEDWEYNMRLDEWLNADDFNFAHDFYGIVDNINREKGFPATDFGFFVPRFAGRCENACQKEGDKDA